MPVYDQDLTSPNYLSFHSCILRGFARINCPVRLKAYGTVWGKEIQADENVERIREAYAKRMTELKGGTK